MNLLATFLQRAILQGVPILYGASGEILRERRESGRPASWASSSRSRRPS